MKIKMKAVELFLRLCAKVITFLELSLYQVFSRICNPPKIISSALIPRLPETWDKPKLILQFDKKFHCSFGFDFWFRFSIIDFSYDFSFGFRFSISVLVC